VGDELFPGAENGPPPLFWGGRHFDVKTIIFINQDRLGTNIGIR
jgi:hypothetical protein